MLSTSGLGDVYGSSNVVFNVNSVVVVNSELMGISLVVDIVVPVVSSVVVKISVVVDILISVVRVASKEVRIYETVEIVASVVLGGSTLVGLSGVLCIMVGNSVRCSDEVAGRVGGGMGSFVVFGFLAP